MKEKVEYSRDSPHLGGVRLGLVVPRRPPLSVVPRADAVVECEGRVRDHYDRDDAEDGHQEDFERRSREVRSFPASTLPPLSLPLEIS